MRSFLFCLVAVSLFACKECQPEKNEAEIHTFLDQWHQAAANADETLFFGSMSVDGIYLGTDETEKWLRDELKEWSKTYFDRESAWDFTPYDRGVYFSADGRVAWFDEKLETWMGICRGSGVLELGKDSWELKHYHLSVTVPNDRIKAFISLVNQEDQMSSDSTQVDSESE